MEKAQLENLLKLPASVLEHLVDAANGGHCMISVAVPKSDNQNEVTVHICTHVFPVPLLDKAKQVMIGQIDRLIESHKVGHQSPIDGAGGLKIGEAMRPPQD